MWVSLILLLAAHYCAAYPISTILLHPYKRCICLRPKCIPTKHLIQLTPAALFSPTLDFFQPWQGEKRRFSSIVGTAPVSGSETGIIFFFLGAVRDPLPPLLLIPIIRSAFPPLNPVCPRIVDLSYHRHLYVLPSGLTLSLIIKTDVDWRRWETLWMVV